MATTKDTMEQRLQQLEEQNRRMAQALGLAPKPDADVTKRADFIAHGSAEHAVFLGLIEVDDIEAAKADGYIVYTSPASGKSWRLEDEVSPFTSFPNPEKIAGLTLRQKVSSLESGRPGVPADAPPLIVPMSAF